MGFSSFTFWSKHLVRFLASTLCSPSPRPAPSGRGRALLVCVPKCVLNNLPLFLFVAASGARSRSGRCRPSEPGKGKSLEKPVAKLDSQVRPCSHIDRFLL